MSFFFGSQALLFRDSGLISGLEFGEVRVVVGKVKVDRGHLLRCRITGYNLDGGWPGREIRDGGSWLALKCGSPIHIVDGWHAHELPDLPVGRGEIAVGRDEAPVRGRPENDGFGFSLRSVVDECAGLMATAAVDGSAYAQKSTLLFGGKYRARVARGRQYRRWRKRHGKRVFADLLHGKQAVSEIVGG